MVDTIALADRPHENLFRARALWIRSDEGEGMPTLFGHAAVFNRWTEINSFWEGRFLERLAPGAFAKTIQEQRAQIRCLLDHGFDPMAGRNPLGAFEDLREDDTGLYYEVPLFDVDYVHRIIPGLRAGQYGASFRFWIVKEEVNNDPGRSDHNPEGLPEVTLLEVGLRELGPTAFGAYPDATAGARSISDHFNDLRTPPGEPRADRPEPPQGTPTATPTLTGQTARAHLDARARTDRLAQIRKDLP